MVAADPMPRWFNTAGPCKPGYHYMLPPERRVPQVRGVIDHMHYFVLHAPRQTGKTTILRGLAAALTEEGSYAAVWVSAEQGQAFSDIGAAEAAMLGCWAAAAELLPAELRPPPWPATAPGDRVRAVLGAWAAHCPRGLVVLFDAIDACFEPEAIARAHALTQGQPWLVNALARQVVDVLESRRAWR
jgi:hypothetical protein